MTSAFHSFCIAGTHSGVGKTTVTLGVLAALRRRGLQVQPFKCGPDYIDSGYHARACGMPSRNLDTWMMGVDGVKTSFARATVSADVAVVEGVMGLYDGASAFSDEGSTAHVARTLNLPVLLVINGKSMARSVAALVKGYAEFESDVRIVGVIANAVSSEKHAALLSDSLQAYGLPPLLGWLPRQDALTIPERHLGLLADTEGEHDAAWFDTLADLIESRIDLDRLLQLCTVPRPTMPTPVAPVPGLTPPVRLGIARDDAFHFYYEDNLDLLRECGIELVPFSPLRDATLPTGLAGLYIGGGFPEMFARELDGNSAMRGAIRSFAEAGGVVYAECGGLMYLCRKLTDPDGHAWAMCGVLPADTVMEKRRNRLGYVEARTLEPGLFGAAGTAVRGHEFHWSGIRAAADAATDGAATPMYAVRYMRDAVEHREGFHLGSVWASYVHVHFASNPDAARAWVQLLRTLGNS